MPWHWPSFASPQLDWLQVEISTHCNAACLYCPRTLYAAHWRNRLMSLEDFRRLAPVLRTTRLVYLQGWGEPLTHPDFFTFARLAKACGCQVGTTTNGMLLSEEVCRRLIEAEIDVVGFSLAGTVAAENDRIRRGTSLQQALACIETLNRLKAQLGADKPAVHVAYLLLRSGLAAVEALPGLLAPLGVDQVVISTLDLIARQDLAVEALAPASLEEHAALRQRLDAVIAAGREQGLPIHDWLAEPQGQRSVGSAEGTAPEAACTENVCKAAFVAVDGGVSPCVYANLPLAGGAIHWVGGGNGISGISATATPLRPIVFGNLQRQSFAAVWRSRAYADFRRAHQQGRPPEQCQGCVRLRMCSVEKAGVVW
jgi:MoaA/NifB/PqqE/SkfB family radical SAM enzyme